MQQEKETDKGKEKEKEKKETEKEEEKEAKKKHRLCKHPRQKNKHPRSTRIYTKLHVHVSDCNKRSTAMTMDARVLV